MSKAYEFKTRNVIINRVQVGQATEYFNKKLQRNENYWRCGVLIGEVWYNQTFFSKVEVDTLEGLEHGSRVILTLFKENYEKDGETRTARKFRFPSEPEIQSLKIATFMKVAFDKFPELKQAYENEISG